MSSFFYSVFIHSEDWSQCHTNTFHCLYLCVQEDNDDADCINATHRLLFGSNPPEIWSQITSCVQFPFSLSLLFHCCPLISCSSLFCLTEISQIFRYFSYFPWSFLCWQLIVCSQSDNIFFRIFSLLSLFLTKDCHHIKCHLQFCYFLYLFIILQLMI